MGVQHGVPLATSRDVGHHRHTAVLTVAAHTHATIYACRECIAGGEGVRMPFLETCATIGARGRPPWPQLQHKRCSRGSVLRFR